MDAHGTGLLRQAGDRLLYLAAGSHQQVGKLIYNYHNIREILVSLERVEPAAQELLVVFGNLAHAAVTQQVVTLIHLCAKGAQSMHYLGGVGYDDFVGIGQNRQVVLLKFLIEVQLDLLGVDHHELHLRRVLCIEQGRDNSVQADRLTHTGGTGNQKVRHSGQIQEERLVGNGDTQRHRKLHFWALFAVLRRIEYHLQRHYAGLFVGHLDTDGVFQHQHTDALGRQGHRDVLFQPLDLGDAGALCQTDLVQSDCRTFLGRNAVYTDLICTKRMDDTVFVALHLVQRNLVPLVLVVVQQGNRREFIVREVQTGIVEVIHIVLAHIGLGIESASLYSYFNFACAIVRVIGRFVQIYYLFRFFYGCRLVFRISVGQTDGYGRFFLGLAKYVDIVRIGSCGSHSLFFRLAVEGAVDKLVDGQRHPARAEHQPEYEKQAYD